jgi:hypothetical protein
MTLTLRTRILGGAGLVVLIFSGGVWLFRRQATKFRAAAADQASQQADAVRAATQEAQGYRTQAEGFLADLNTLKAQAAVQAKENARLRAANPKLLEAPQGVPDPCPNLRALAVLQEGQIQTQAEVIGTWEKRGTALEGEAAALGRAAQVSDQVAQGLRAQLAALPVDHPWSVGPLVGINATGQLRFGVIASGAYKRVHGHALLLGDTAALGVSFRFGGGR